MSKTIHPNIKVISKTGKNIRLSCDQRITKTTVLFSIVIVAVKESWRVISTIEKPSIKNRVSLKFKNEEFK